MFYLNDPRICKYVTPTENSYLDSNSVLCFYENSFFIAHWGHLLLNTSLITGVK